MKAFLCLLLLIAVCSGTIVLEENLRANALPKQVTSDYPEQIRLALTGDPTEIVSSFNIFVLVGFESGSFRKSHGSLESLPTVLFSLELCLEVMSVCCFVV
jgi:hypothetical protein